MGGWQRVWVLASLLTLAGCSSPSVPSVPTASEDPASPEKSTAPAPSPEVPLDSGTPLPADGGTGGSVPAETVPPQALRCAPTAAGDAGLPVLADGGESPTLALPACVPCNQTPPAHEAPACEVTVSTLYEIRRSRYDAQGTLRDYRVSQAHGGPTLQRQYDAEGHLLKEQTWTIEGTPWELVTNVWVNGLQWSSETTQLSTSVKDKWDWMYDDQHRVEQRADSYAFGPTWFQGTVHQYFYDDAGRLARIEHWSDDTVSFSRYQYDAAGRLTRVTSESKCNRDLSRCESHAYDEAGQKRAFSWIEASGRAYRESYDAQGRLLTTDLNEVESAWESSERQYDEQGLLSAQHLASGRSGSSSTSLVRYLYGDKGQLLLEWWATRDVYVSSTDRRHTIRSTYLCDSSLPYLKETDKDGDGVVDLRCTYERDEAGRLLREQCGFPDAQDPYSSRTEYRYDCEP